jgi:branched-chain amino acid transport system substrate-binding protein
MTYITLKVCGRETERTVMTERHKTNQRIRRSLMKKKMVLFFLCMMLAVLGISGQEANAQLKPGDPIVIAVPTPLGSINGRGNWMAIQMAVDEINAKGGVKVGKTMHPMKAYAIDTRDHEPEIPVHDALNAVEKIILEKKPHAIVSGAFRSEVLLASMDLIARYKIPYFATIAMTPMLQKKVLEDYEKYKYMFRTCISVPHFIMYLSNILEFLKKEFGYSRVHIVVQDVLWTQGSGKAIEKWCKDKGFFSVPDEDKSRKSTGDCAHF